MLPQSINLINCVSFLFFRFLAEVVASSHVQVTWAHHCDAPYGLEVRHPRFEDYKFSSPKAQLQRSLTLWNQEVMKQTSNWHMQNIKNFATPTWWDFACGGIRQDWFSWGRGGHAPIRCSRTHHSNLCTRWGNELPLTLSKHHRGNNQQRVFLKAPVCQHHLVKLFLSKVRG